MLLRLSFAAPRLDGLDRFDLRFGERPGNPTGVRENDDALGSRGQMHTAQCVGRDPVCGADAVVEDIDCRLGDLPIEFDRFR